MGSRTSGTRNPKPELGDSLVGSGIPGTRNFTAEFQNENSVVNPPVANLSRRSIIFCSKVPSADFKISLPTVSCPENVF